jgi:hypothetical protein
MKKKKQVKKRIPAVSEAEYTAWVLKQRKKQ